MTTQTNHAQTKPTSAPFLPLGAAMFASAVLAAYRLTLHWQPALDRIMARHTVMGVPGLIPNALFLILLATLGITYHRWYRTAVRQRDLEGVISSIDPDIILTVAPDRTITFCSESIKRIYGYDPSDVIGRKTDMLYRDRRPAEDPGEIHSALESYGFHEGEALARRRNGETFPVEIVTDRLRHSPGVVILLRDITKRKRAENQLVAAKQCAETAEHAKSEALDKLENQYSKLANLESTKDKLTHMIVHDFKSPLFTISGYLQLIKDFGSDSLGQTEKEYLNEITNLTHYLTQMATSLLDVSRLERNEMPFHFDSADLCRLAEQAADYTGVRSNHHKLLMSFPSGGVNVECDSGVVRRILINLLQNAANFTPEGGEISVDISEDGDIARICVTDTGPGIPREHQDIIFEHFGQLEARQHSTGLGLTFCKLAVEAHHGRIGVESEVNLGTKMWFTLPKQQSTARPTEDAGQKG